MSIFSLFKGQSTGYGMSSDPASEPIPKEDLQYYKPSSYYTKTKKDGFGRTVKVPSFAERKKTSIPSDNGLFVPEILLLSYCHKYPNPKAGYPGFWWFTYGVRNVGALLKSLEHRGFIEFNLQTKRYKLTPLGEQELSENEYVLYMHKNSVYADFTAWEMNSMLGHGDKSRYLPLYEKWNRSNQKKIEDTRADLRKINPKLAKTLDDEDKDIAELNKRREQYKTDKDLNSYIVYMENLWASGKPPFYGSTWAFTLPDLYIKAKRYDDALKALAFIEHHHIGKQYKDKVEKYRANITARIYGNPRL